MKTEQVLADVEIGYKGKALKIKCLLDTGASLSIISKDLAEKIGAFIPFEEPKKPYIIRTADEKGKLKIVGESLLEVVFQGIEVPGRVLFEVAENLRGDLHLVIGRPEIDKWDIIFTPEGPRPRKVPIEFELI